MKIQLLLLAVLVTLPTCKAQKKNKKKCIWPADPKAKVKVMVDGEQRTSKCKNLKKFCDKSKSVRRMCPGACCSCNNPAHVGKNGQTFKIEREDKKPLFKTCNDIGALKDDVKKHTRFCSYKEVKINCPLACKAHKCPVVEKPQTMCNLTFKLEYPGGLNKYPGFEGYHSCQMHIAYSKDAADDAVCMPGQNTPYCEFQNGSDDYAFFLYEKDDEGNMKYYDYGEQNAWVREAHGSTTMVYINHNYDKYETLFDTDDVPAFLSIWKNNKKIANGLQHTPGTVDNATHNADKSINLNYPGHYAVKVECDENCSSCTVEKVQPKCNVHAKLYYPFKVRKDFKKKTDTSRADIVSVFKKGNRDWCGVNSLRTSWGCLHEGSTFLDKERKASVADATYSTAHIQNAIGEYTWYVSHWYQRGQDEEEPGTYAPKLEVFVNGEKKQVSIPTKPLNAINGHPGSFTQKMICNDSCECEFEEKRDRNCRIHASLSYPDWSRVRFGVHEEKLSITKEGQDQICDGVNSPYTKWTCIFSGASTAYVEKWQDSAYYHVRTKQSADIMAAMGGTFTITKTHLPYKYYGNDGAPYYDEDVNSDTNTKAELWIEVNDKTIYDGYSNSKREITIECDSACDCKIRKNKE